MKTSISIPIAAIRLNATQVLAMIGERMFVFSYE